MVGLPVLGETSFETIVRGLSPRGVEEKIQKGFAVVERWEWSGAASEKDQASRLTAKELVERKWIQRASIAKETLEWGYSVVGKETA